jgi:hypothetical protein
MANLLTISLTLATFTTLIPRYFAKMLETFEPLPQLLLAPSNSSTVSFLLESFRITNDYVAKMAGFLAFLECIDPADAPQISTGNYCSGFFALLAHTRAN